MRSFFSSYKKEDIYRCYMYISSDTQSEFTIFRLKPIHDDSLIKNVKLAFASMHVEGQTDYTFIPELGLFTLCFSGARFDLIEVVKSLTLSNHPSDIFGFQDKSIQVFLTEKMMQDISVSFISLTAKKKPESPSSA